MNHHHHHHPIAGEPQQQKKLIIICLIINLVFVIIEAGAGYLYNSIGLLSDAGHNLSDILGLVLSLIGIILAQSAQKEKAKIGSYVTLLNSLLLIATVIIIGIESIRKIIQPSTVNGLAVVITSTIAIIINGLTATLLQKGSHQNTNIKAAYLHAATDALVSLGVLVSGLLIALTGYNIIDGIISLLITIIIAIPAFRLLLSAKRELQ